MIVAFVVVVAVLGVATGWLLRSRRQWRRKALDAVAETARLRDLLGRQRRAMRPDPDLVALRMEERLGLAVVRPEDTVRVVNPY
jgi:hypothetical protein